MPLEKQSACQNPKMIGEMQRDFWREEENHSHSTE